MRRVYPYNTSLKHRVIHYKSTGHPAYKNQPTNSLSLGFFKFVSHHYHFFEYLNLVEIGGFEPPTSAMRTVRLVYQLVILATSSSLDVDNRKAFSYLGCQLVTTSFVQSSSKLVAKL